MVVAAALVAVFIAGCLIGATGIGGVLVVPALGLLMGLPVDTAVATASCAFLVTGALALVQARRAGVLASPSSWGLLLASLPGSWLGAVCAGLLPPAMLLALVAALCVLSGAWGLLRPAPACADAPLARWTAAALGLAVGAGSALTGTGGPVLLTPALVLLRQPVGRVIVLGQLIQFPIALCATAAHAGRGAIAWDLAIVVGVILLAGALAGGRLSARVPTGRLGTAVCWLLVLVGAGLAARAWSA